MSGISLILLCFFVTARAADIVDTAVGTGSHTILAEALTKANLVDALKGTGPFTVFAPTDTAFQNALTALGITKEQLLNLPNLATILKHHVISGRYPSSDLQASQSVATLAGQNVMITKDGSSVFYGDVAKVTTADVGADNGIIHVIDAVVFPLPDIVDTAVANGNFNILAEALTKAGLVDALKGAGPFTVFAPTDTAFQNMLAREGITKEQLLGHPELASILKFHVIAGSEVMAADLQASQSVPTLAGQNVMIRKDGSTVFYGSDGAKVTMADVKAGNGVIHVIDAVASPDDHDDHDEEPTCGDIKKAYKASHCCGNPSKPFKMDHMDRRLSVSKSGSYFENEASTIAAVRKAMKDAKAKGTYAAELLKKDLLATLRPYM